MQITKIKQITTADRIRLLLQEKGISQLKLADQLETSPQTVSAWMKGSPPHRFKKQLAEFFDVDVDYIMCKQPYRKKSERFKEYNQKIQDIDFEAIRTEYEQQKTLIRLLELFGYKVIAVTPKEEPPEQLHIDEDGIEYTITEDAAFSFDEFIQDPEGKRYKFNTNDLFNRIKNQIIFEISLLEPAEAGSMEGSEEVKTAPARRRRKKK